MTAEYESDHDDHDDGAEVWSFLSGVGLLDCGGWSLEAATLTCACGAEWAIISGIPVLALVIRARPAELAAGGSPALAPGGGD